LTARTVGHRSSRRKESRDLPFPLAAPQDREGGRKRERGNEHREDAGHAGRGAGEAAQIWLESRLDHHRVHIQVDVLGRTEIRLMAKPVPNAMVLGEPETGGLGRLPQMQSGLLNRGGAGDPACTSTLPMSRHRQGGDTVLRRTPVRSEPLPADQNCRVASLRRQRRQAGLVVYVGRRHHRAHAGPGRGRERNDQRGRHNPSPANLLAAQVTRGALPIPLAFWGRTGVRETVMAAATSIRCVGANAMTVRATIHVPPYRSLRPTTLVRKRQPPALSTRWTCISWWHARARVAPMNAASDGGLAAQRHRQLTVRPRSSFACSVVPLRLTSTPDPTFGSPSERGPMAKHPTPRCFYFAIM